MPREKNIEDKTRELIDQAAPKKRPPRAKKTEPSTIVTSIGDGNIVAGGNVSINKKEVQRVVVQPGPQHINEQQAFELKRLVDKAVEIEGISGKTTDGLYQKWYAKLKNQFKVTSYKTIPADLGECAISWMQQQVAMLHPKLRRTDKDAWRKEHYQGIWARSKQLGLSKEDVYKLAEMRITKKPISSLTDLGDRHLKKLYQVIMALPK